LYAPPVQRLITELGKLPGVGARTAQRLAFHILRASPQDATALADAIREVKERIGFCEVCFNLADRLGERQRLVGRRAQDVEREPLRGALPDAGQARELGDEAVDGGCEHGSRSVLGGAGGPARAGG
jgi:hypothetical protein